MNQELTRHQLAIARAMCDESLLFFTRFFFKELDGKRFVVNEHHEELCNYYMDIEKYKLKLLNINIPPRHSKTEIMLMFIARGLGMRHSSNWLYITASDDLRKLAATRIRAIITHPYFKIMYGLEISKDQNNKNIIKTTGGGGLKTASIFGQVTGFGAGEITEKEEIDEDTLEVIRTFEGAQCWDDLNKMDDADQENANNEKVTRVVFNTLFSRENSEDTPIAHIQQRAGMSDVTQSLMDHFGLESERHKFVVMPVIRDGKPLWEGKLSLDGINELATSPKTRHTFETQYMQNPQPKEGLIFARSELQYYDELPPKEEWEVKIGYSDPADEGLDSHSFPILIVANGIIYVPDVMFTRDNLSIAEPTVLAKLAQWDLDMLYVEANNHGAPWIRELRPKTTVKVHGLKNSVKKMSRMIAQEGYIKEHFRFRKDFLPESEYDQFMQQIWRILKDGSVKKDDAPDSLAGGAFAIRRYYGSLISTVK